MNAPMVEIPTRNDHATVTMRAPVESATFRNPDRRRT